MHFDIDAGSVGLRNRFRQPANSPLDDLAGRCIQPTRGSFQHCFPGNGVCRCTSLERTDRDHAGTKRIERSRNNRLQSMYQSTAGDDGIDAKVRLGGVGSAANNRDLKEVGRRHDRPVSPMEFALRHGWEIMHAEDETHREAIE